MPESLSSSRRHFLIHSAMMMAGASLLPLAGCGPRHVPGGGYALPGPDVSGGRSLRSHAADARLLFGFALNTQQLRDDAAYRSVVEQQCSIVVSEDAMKWRALRPVMDRYAFDDADTLVDFAATRRIKLRGHTLCWHEALPDWFAAEVRPLNARQILRDHIRTVAGRYAGRMHSWDVVNEAVEVKDGRPDGLRNSVWLQMVGTDYIEMAFRVARDADPSALLTYNDYGMEAETADAAQKRAAVLLLLRRLKQRNVPIDAVGIQSHLQASSRRGYGSGLQHFVESCREMGLEVFVTEMDVDDRTLPSRIDARDAAVAERYRSYLDLLLPAPNVTAVMTWGVSDAETWLKGRDHARADGLAQRPLLFDDHFHPKAAFTSVCAVFDHRARAGKLSFMEVRPEKALPKL